MWVLRFEYYSSYSELSYWAYIDEYFGQEPNLTISILFFLNHKLFPNDKTCQKTCANKDVLFFPGNLCFKMLVSNYCYCFISHSHAPLISMQNFLLIVTDLLSLAKYFLYTKLQCKNLNYKGIPKQLNVAESESGKKAILIMRLFQYLLTLQLIKRIFLLITYPFDYSCTALFLRSLEITTLHTFK